MADVENNIEVVLTEREKFDICCGMIAATSVSNSKGTFVQDSTPLKPISIKGTRKIGIEVSSVKYKTGVNTYDISIYTHDVDIPYSGFSILLNFSRNDVTLISTNVSSNFASSEVNITTTETSVHILGIKSDYSEFSGEMELCVLRFMVNREVTASNGINLCLDSSSDRDTDYTTLLKYKTTEQGTNLYYITPIQNESGGIFSDVAGESMVIGGNSSIELRKPVKPGFYVTSCEVEPNSSGSVGVSVGIGNYLCNKIVGTVTVGVGSSGVVVSELISNGWTIQYAIVDNTTIEFEATSSRYITNDTVELFSVLVVTGEATNYKVPVSVTGTAYDTSDESVGLAYLGCMLVGWIICGGTDNISFLNGGANGASAFNSGAGGYMVCMGNIFCGGECYVSLSSGGGAVIVHMKPGWNRVSVYIPIINKDSEIKLETEDGTYILIPVTFKTKIITNNNMDVDLIAEQLKNTLELINIGDDYGIEVGTTFNGDVEEVEDMEIEDDFQVEVGTSFNGDINEIEEYEIEDDFQVEVGTSFNGEVVEADEMEAVDDFNVEVGTSFNGEVIETDEVECSDDYNIEVGATFNGDEREIDEFEVIDIFNIDRG